VKNYVKILAVAAILIFSSLLFIACGEFGGTIIVNNNYDVSKSVTVYSDFSQSGFLFYYRDRYGPITIEPNSSGTFNVSSNSTYGIIWRHQTNVDRVKTVDISGGEIVEINIP